MFSHMKVIGLSVGLLVILSGLSTVSFAVARHRAEPAPQKLAGPVSLQSAQASVATGATLQAIAGGY